MSDRLQGEGFIAAYSRQLVNQINGERRSSIGLCTTGSSLILQQYPLSVACDHQLFVGGNDPHRDTASIHTDARPTLVVGGRVEFHPQPNGIAADTLTDQPAVFADAGGEYKGIESAKGGGE